MDEKLFGAAPSIVSKDGTPQLLAGGQGPAGGESASGPGGPPSPGGSTA